MADVRYITHVTWPDGTKETIDTDAPLKWESMEDAWEAWRPIYYRMVYRAAAVIPEWSRS